MMENNLVASLAATNKHIFYEIKPDGSYKLEQNIPYVSEVISTPDRDGHRPARSRGKSKLRIRSQPGAYLKQRTVGGAIFALKPVIMEGE